MKKMVGTDYPKQIIEKASTIVEKSHRMIESASKSDRIIYDLQQLGEQIVAMCKHTSFVKEKK